MIFEKRPPFECIYMESFALICKSFALIRESYAFFRERFALIRGSDAFICESFALIREKKFPTKMSSMGFRTKIRF